jgi:hypothetical protein
VLVALMALGAGILRPAASSRATPPGDARPCRVTHTPPAASRLTLLHLRLCGSTPTPMPSWLRRRS